MAKACRFAVSTMDGQTKPFSMSRAGWREAKSYALDRAARGQSFIEMDCVDGRAILAVCERNKKGVAECITTHEAPGVAGLGRSRRRKPRRR